MIFFTSDLHFGHKNIIPYCNRPFATLEEMHDFIVKLWNDTIKPEDTVYMLGDFSLNPKWSKLIVPKLNGSKILIAGNHDAVWSNEQGKLRTVQVEKYLNDGWKEVHKYLTIEFNGVKVLLSHLPYKSNTEHDQRYIEHRPVDNGEWLFHGHLHGAYKKLGKQIDVGIDAHEMRILSESDMIELMSNNGDVKSNVVKSNNKVG
jgi:calcineurin-like phosphoesterase family protein